MFVSCDQSSGVDSQQIGTMLKDTEKILVDTLRWLFVLHSLNDSRRKPLRNNGFHNRQGCLRNTVLLNTQAFELCIKVFV